jgi:hypothetical protein
MSIIDEAVKKNIGWGRVIDSDTIRMPARTSPRRHNLKLVYEINEALHQMRYLAPYHKFSPWTCKCFLAEVVDALCSHRITDKNEASQPTTLR